MDRTFTSLIIALSATAALMAGTAIGLVAGATLPDCEWETGEGQTMCVWHADREGNSEGDSLLLVAGAEIARW